MKTIFSTMLVVALGLFAHQAIAENYEIDIKGQHAFVTFKASHLGYSYILGRFNDFQGTFTYDVDNPSKANVEVVIDAASVDTEHAERDKHLRSEDFFDVERYPQVTFKSTAFEESGDGDAKLRGTLNLHGVSKEVTLNVTHIGAGDDPWGGYRRGLEGHITLAAADYGMPAWVGNVDVYIVVEGIRK